MVNKFLITILIILFNYSQLYAADTNLKTRGSGGSIDKKIVSSKSSRIKISSNLLDIKKFKSTFSKYKTQNKKEKMIMSSLKNNKTKKNVTTGILLRGSAKRVYLASKKSVFFIINPVAFEETDTKEIIRGATGTGSLISSEGLIVTNYHVVENANQVWVYPYAKKFDLEKSKKFLGIVVSTNKVTDLAILKVYGISSNNRPVPFGNMDSISVGDEVYAIGHPDSLHWSITDGIISNIRKNYDFKKFDLKADLIQNTAPILGGSSGGPLLNERGQIIGVNTIGDSSANFNFAVGVNHIRNLLEKVPHSIKFNLDKIKTVNEKELSKQFTNITPGDYNNNGIIDEWSVDTNNNNINDTLYVDDDEDGRIERIYIDSNENDKWDLIVYDDDLDGNPNRQVIDNDEDGKPDTIAYDFNQDGVWDKFEDVS
ncbi:serine protease [Candidatus Pelagibacter ubique]|nr:serine protease [Candidatus Pelagibacter ubique]